VDPQTPLEESVGTIAEYRDAGKIRHVGLSQVGVDQIELARTIVPIAAVQNHYNLSERGWDEVIDRCAREGIVFVPYFPLKGGGGGGGGGGGEGRGGGGKPPPPRSAWRGSWGARRRRCRSRARCRWST
jgi:aryl-alcohol dehydrogenase-like predicted oxidoreductase